MPHLLAEDGGQRQHRQWLRSLLNTTTGPVRIASAYITDRDLLLVHKNRKIRILTFLCRMDIISGATSLDSIRSLVEAGVHFRYLSGGPRLHAKVYMFGSECAVVTSANLTKSALDTNIEVGVHLAGKPVQKLIVWFDGFWNTADRLGLQDLTRWEQLTQALRLEYARLQKKAQGKPTFPNEASPSARPGTGVVSPIESVTRAFVCNTNRRWSIGVEELMRKRGYAAVWEDFRYAPHMKRVEPNDAIFMYAKGAGIIGVGLAKARCEILNVNASNRIGSANEFNVPEWRIPVDWLAWAEKDADACPFSIPNVSFVDVSGENYSVFRETIKKHFLLDL